MCDRALLDLKRATPLPHQQLFASRPEWWIMATFAAFRQAVLSTCRFRPPARLGHPIVLPSSLGHTIRFASKDASKDDSKGSSAVKILRNEKIPHKIVQLVDPVTKALRPAQPLEEILATIDKKTHILELVVEKPSPIVKILDKKAEYDKKKQAKRRANEVKRRNVQKEVQLTWGVGLQDLEHKLKKVRSDLEKGYRVDLVFAPKSGHELPSPADMNKRAEKTVALLSDVAREWKPREVRKTVIAIFFQGLGEAQEVSS